MKLSQFNLMVEVDTNQTAYYNTLTRDYFLMDKADYETVNGLVQNLHRDSYTEEEAAIILDLTKNKFILHDGYDEIEKIRNHENAVKTQEKSQIIVFKTTLDCNLRCTYCYQEHDPICMDDKIEAEMIQYVTEASKRCKQIVFVWFGGEPLLEADRMKAMSRKMIDICNENNCDYHAAMTTNGYLLNDNLLNSLESMKIKKMQITLDGIAKHHDVTRPHMDGSGTFDVIYNNIIKALKLNLKLTLRINVNQDNYLEIVNLLDMIPMDLREHVRISMANWFQNKDKMSLYSIYQASIDKGYRYARTSNEFNLCERNFDNSISVLPNGNVVNCSQKCKATDVFGRLKDGKLIIENEEAANKAANRGSITDNERCRKCIELPICMGGCVDARMKDPTYCAKFVPDGLTILEKVKLHVLSDLRFNSKAVKRI